MSNDEIEATIDTAVYSIRVGEVYVDIRGDSLEKDLLNLRKKLKELEKQNVNGTTIS
jgi:hypothetical protein